MLLEQALGLGGELTCGGVRGLPLSCDRPSAQLKVKGPCIQVRGVEADRLGGADGSVPPGADPVQGAGKEELGGSQSWQLAHHTPEFAHCSLAVSGALVGAGHEEAKLRRGSSLQQGLLPLPNSFARVPPAVGQLPPQRRDGWRQGVKLLDLLETGLGLRLVVCVEEEVSCCFQEGIGLRAERF